MTRLRSSAVTLFLFSNSVLVFVSAQTNASNSTANNAFVAPFNISLPTPTPTLSGCQICDQKGDCSHAYKGGPGKYCGHWLDMSTQQQSCCCPTNWVCRLSTYGCNCSNTMSTQAPTSTYVTFRSQRSPWWWLWSLILVFVVAAAIIRCCCRRRPEVAYVSEPVPNVMYAGQPVQPGYNFQQPMYAAGQAGYGGRSGVGAGTAAALGGAAGLAGGILLGGALADHHDHFGGGYDGGYVGGDFGGGDFGGGDFGGGFAGDF